ncbi:MAG: hypothetical protein H7836_12415 [Magnetococcus sp. YQC-3]
MGTSANIASEIFSKTTDQYRIDLEFSKEIFNNVFFKNLDGLKENSNIVLFNNPKWEQNPKQFCIDHYGDPGIYKIVLLINSIPSIFSFKSDQFKNFKIYAPKLNDIYKVLAFVK